MIMAFEKKDDAKFTSHLDMQRAIQRVLRRAGVPVRYSQGFNPHMLLSFASALSLGFTSRCEYVDVTMDDYDTQAFAAAVSAAMPASLGLVGAKAVPDNAPALTALLAFAEYELTFKLDASKSDSALQSALDELLSAPIIAVKKGKSGETEIDLRDLIISANVSEVRSDSAVMKLKVKYTASGALNPTLLVPHIQRVWNCAASPRICRTALLDSENKPLMGL